MCFGWVANHLFSIPRQLLVFIIAFETLPEGSVPSKQTTLDFYNNHNDSTILHFSDNMEPINQSILNSLIMNCLIEQCMKINWSFLRRRVKITSCGVCLTSLKTYRNKKLIVIITRGKMVH